MRLWVYLLLLLLPIVGQCAFYTLPKGTTRISPFYDSHQELYNLTNFSRNAVVINGIYYPTTEHFFQAQKFMSPHDRRISFLNEVKKRGDGPRQALEVARQWTKNWSSYDWQNWENRKEKVMEEALRAKLEQYPNIVKELINTENSCLVEDTAPHDEKEWGWGSDGKGRNRLGLLWMNLRNEVFVLTGKQHWMVDPHMLYAQVQKERQPLGRRTALIQKWSDVNTLQKHTPFSKVSNLLDLSHYALKKMKRGENVTIKTRGGARITYGISQVYGTFYIRGKDKRGRSIDVYVKNKQIYENGKPVKSSGWANWAFPIVKKDLGSS